MFASLNELHKLGYIHRDLKPEVSEATRDTPAMVASLD
jgi:serine/threonine protein kinase